MPWVSRLLRGDRVYVRTAVDGTPITGSDGRVDVVYKPGGKVYRAGLRNLAEDPSPQRLNDEAPAVVGVETAGGSESIGGIQSTPPTPPRRAKAPARAPGESAAPATNPYIVYADGACSGNPGPCGIGVVLIDGAHREEISEYLGVGTNNVAELTAIVRALERAPKDRTVIIHSDSAYALGLLGKAWKAKANQALVEEMRQKARGFRDLRLVKVAGHAGIPENERADALARDSVVRRR